MDAKKVVESHHRHFECNFLLLTFKKKLFFGRGPRCDQMVRLFFKIWPFTAMKISPIISQICQSMLSILPNKKWTVKNLPKYL